MQTQALLWHYIVAGAGFVVLGLLGHVCRAVFNILPDRLSDHAAMDLILSDGYNLSDRIFGTEYDDAGYYRIDSGRNLRNAIAFSLIGGWAAMLLVPGMSSVVAGGINAAAGWLWELFLFRIGDLHLF